MRQGVLFKVSVFNVKADKFAASKTRGQCCVQSYRALEYLSNAYLNSCYSNEAFDIG